MVTLFLSTPSARRATQLWAAAAMSWAISIHALREEGDICSLGYDQLAQIFLSTPSARRATPENRQAITDVLFLSTPSARRATTA